MNATTETHPTETEKSIVNIAAYKFVDLDDLPTLQSDLKQQCEQAGLKGTILLSPEGINLFMAGSRESIDGFLDHLRCVPEFADLTAKESFSNRQPFNRMLVRLKKEIIAFGVDGIEPAKKTSPKLPAKELKRWLDEGKKVTLLDTRNEFEVDLGTFVGAKNLHITSFRDFPETVQKLPEEMKDEPIVMFCTGGIRCEKAGPYMEREGFKQIYQLDGGILKYFEECGGDHWDGECFVFDHRVALDPQLQETHTAVCFACREPLTPEDQESELYVLGEHCPYCYERIQSQQPKKKSRRAFREPKAAE